MEDKKEEISVFFTIRLLILHYTYTCTACILAALTHPLYYTVALDNENEARYCDGVKNCVPRNRQVEAHSCGKKKAKAMIGKKKIMNNTS